MGSKKEKKEKVMPKRLNVIRETVNEMHEESVISDAVRDHLMRLLDPNEPNDNLNFISSADDLKVWRVEVPDEEMPQCLENSPVQA